MLSNEELILDERWQAVIMLTRRWKDRLYETRDYLRINDRVFIYTHQRMFCPSHYPISVKVEASLILSITDRKKVILHQ